MKGPHIMLSEGVMGQRGNCIDNNMIRLVIELDQDKQTFSTSLLRIR